MSDNMPKVHSQGKPMIDNAKIIEAAKYIYDVKQLDEMLQAVPYKDRPSFKLTVNLLSGKGFAATYRSEGRARRDGDSGRYRQRQGHSLKGCLRPVSQKQAQHDRYACERQKAGAETEARSKIV